MNKFRTFSVHLGSWPCFFCTFPGTNQKPKPQSNFLPPHALTQQSTPRRALIIQTDGTRERKCMVMIPAVFWVSSPQTLTFWSANLSQISWTATRESLRKRKGSDVRIYDWWGSSKWICLICTRSQVWFLSGLPESQDWKLYPRWGSPNSRKRSGRRDGYCGSG